MQPFTTAEQSSAFVKWLPTDWHSTTLVAFGNVAVRVWPGPARGNLPKPARTGKILVQARRGKEGQEGMK